MRYAFLLAITLCALSLALWSPTHASEPEIGFGAGLDILETQPPVDDDQPDVLLMALLTVGAAGAAGVVALIGYLIRQRTGFWLHRPPERREDETQH